MNERKRVMRFFSAWNDESEERWLEQMAQSGWHLVKVALFYTFEKGDPAKVRYRVDYPPQQKASVDEYVRLCRDAGWDRVSEFCGWQYFRTALPDAPEIYTDMTSRIAKYRRLLVIAVFLAVITMVGNLQWMTKPGWSHNPVALVTVMRWIAIFLFFFWAYVVARMSLYIHILKRKAGMGGSGFSKNGSI